MPRTKTGYTRKRRHKKVLKLAKGYRGTRNRLFKRAKEAVLRAGQHAFIGRKERKRDFRKLWILRINAGIRRLNHNLTYSKLINLLKKADIRLNRKMLSELAVKDLETFKEIAQVTERK